MDKFVADDEVCVDIGSPMPVADRTLVHEIFGDWQLGGMYFESPNGSGCTKAAEFEGRASESVPSPIPAT